MDRKLKVLCLHGYRQDGNKFRSQTGSLRKILKNLVDMTYISAPHLILPAQDETSRSWWFTQENSYSSRDAPETCLGLDVTLELIKKTWVESGPYDGFLGFSQGACLVGLMAAMCKKEALEMCPRFVVLVAGFKSFTKEHQHLYSDLIDVPSLQVIGETDEVIPWQWGEELSRSFVKPVVIKHPGGHFVPGTSSLKPNFISFFQAQREIILDNSSIKF